MRTLRIIFALFCLAVSAAAQSEPAKTRALSLDEGIQIALQHNFDIQIKRYNPDIARFTLAGSYGSYDPSISLSGEHDYNLSPGGVDAQGRSFGGTESDTDRFSTGLQGLLPWGLTYSLGGSLSDQTGTRPGAGIDLNNPMIITNSFVDINTGNTVSFLSTNYGTLPTRDPFETTSGNVGFLQLRQPLLKNFWVDSTRLQIFLNKRNLRISELDFRLQLMTTVSLVEAAYYNLIFAQESVKVQQKALELAERQLAENKKRVEVGAMAPLDEKQAESLAAQSRADLLAAIGSEETQQRVLKKLLSDDYSKWENESIKPTETLVAVPQHFDLQESWRKGLSQRPDLLQQKLSAEKQGYVVRFQRNQLFPQLDVVGTYGYSASDREFSGALRQFRGRDNPFYSFGAQVSIPLGQTGARNSYQAAKATKEQIELQLKQLEQTVLIQIEDAIAVANTSFQRVDATREASRYAEAALEAEQKKLENGKSTSFVVLQLTKDLTAARSAEIRALADYDIALAQIALNEGSTLERRRIDVQLKDETPSSK